VDPGFSKEGYLYREKGGFCSTLEVNKDYCLSKCVEKNFSHQPDALTLIAEALGL